MQVIGWDTTMAQYLDLKMLNMFIMKTDRFSIYKQFRTLIEKNFELPGNCANSHQVLFYINELKSHIKYYRLNFSYVPNIAFYLMEEYQRVVSKIQKKEHLLDLYNVVGR